ncbi:MAG: NFACT RNA binding domain-containing protein [Oscillospiraceae bacterium]|nr:NFACT RNA binding domain-containing protein [Oscillospiraceae bacterium]
MSADACMIKCTALELDRIVTGGRVEKVLQPEKDEINLLVHTAAGSLRLLISASPNNPRVCVTQTQKENPAKAYMFCMLLRKHLNGSHITSITQCGFERVILLEFDTGDEMGFRVKNRIYVEIMGRNSNLVFCDEQDKIISAFRTSDLTSPSDRKIVPGLVYELPPKQDKLDTMSISKDQFLSVIGSLDPNMGAAEAIFTTFAGLSPMTAREMVFSAVGNSTASLAECPSGLLWNSFNSIVQCVKDGNFTPCIVYESNPERKPIDYSFMCIRQYGESAECIPFSSASAAIDGFFSARDKAERMKQKLNDINTILKNAKNRLTKKISLQTQELVECESSSSMKLFGDLITQEIYKIKKGDGSVTATDYSTDPPSEVNIKLDTRLTPAQNAQKYYRGFTKKKNAYIELIKQISIAKSELDYIDSVFDSLSRVETVAQTEEIREELSKSGYGKASLSASISREKQKKPKPAELRSPHGYKVLLGRNNLQNDYVTTVLADKNDYWFHVKNYPGSHVVLVTEGAEPPAEDFTFCAELCAFYSRLSRADSADVDYTLARYVKKPVGSKPGYVTYDKYFTAHVCPKDNFSLPANENSNITQTLYNRERMNRQS